VTFLFQFDEVLRKARENVIAIIMDCLK